MFSGKARHTEKYQKKKKSHQTRIPDWMVKQYLLSPSTEFTRTRNKNRSRKLFLIINTINKPANRTSLADAGEGRVHRDAGLD
jgi:hypothetical protein